MKAPVELDSLLHVDISSNYLTLSHTNLTLFSSLVTINIGQENMTQLGPEDMTMVPRSVTSITVSRVPGLSLIKEFSLSMFNSLNTLIITDNPLVTTLPAHLLTSAPGQLRVNLSSNSITWLHSLCLPWSRVALLDLSLNELECDCRMNWLTQVSMASVSGVCSSPQHLVNTSVSSVDPDTLVSCSSLMDPHNISLISVCLVILSFMLGCVSFACYTLRRNMPLRRLAISDIDVKTPWQTISNAYCQHPSRAGHTPDNVVAGAAPSRWTFIKPDQCQITYNECSGVFTIR